MHINKLLRAVALVAFGSYTAQSLAAEVLTNGDFETGSFSGWTVTNASDDGSCGDDWSVSTSGSTCDTVGGGAAGDGTFSAFNSLDGPGPVQYRLTQSFTVPTGVQSATLSWLQALAWDVFGGAPRSFTVELTDAAGTTVYGTISNQSFTGTGSSPWTPFNQDLTALLQAHEGETVTLAFTSIIPENFTGPAGLGLDNVSLDVVALALPPQQIPTVGIWGIGILAGMVGLLGAFHRRKKPSSP